MKMRTKDAVFLKYFERLKSIKEVKLKTPREL